MLVEQGFRRIGAVVTLALLMSGAALAAGPSGADAAKARGEHMKALGASVKPLVDQMKTDAPDMAVVKASSAKIAVAGAQLPTWFPKGSGPDSGAKTRALPEIWTDATGFAAAEKTFTAESAKLDSLAKAGDINGVKAQFAVVGAACQGCHKKYRGPEKS